MRSRPGTHQKREPGVSYVAEKPVHELFISVRSTHAGTRMALTYSTWQTGDGPSQGHRWVVAESSPKTATSLQHLLNLAVWLCRQAAAGKAQKKR